MFRKYLAIFVVLSLLTMPVAGCETLKNLISKACEHSQVIQDTLEMLQQKLQIVKAFLETATPDELQVELNVKDVPFTVTKDDVINTIALVDQTLGVLKTIIEDACKGDVEQAIKAAEGLNGNATFYAAMMLAQKNGAFKSFPNSTPLMKGWKK